MASLIPSHPNLLVNTYQTNTIWSWCVQLGNLSISWQLSTCLWPNVQLCLLISLLSHKVASFCESQCFPYCLYAAELCNKAACNGYMVFKCLNIYIQTKLLSVNEYSTCIGKIISCVSQSGYSYEYSPD